jgi:hypothetical protein
VSLESTRWLGDEEKRVALRIYAEQLSKKAPASGGGRYVRDGVMRAASLCVKS